MTDPEVPKLINAIYRVPAPATPRNDLVEIFLTGITTKAKGPIAADLNSQLNNADVKAAKFQPSEMLRLNLTVPVTHDPQRLGVLAKDLQGFPNGRRLTDDVVDIELQALEGAAATGALVDALAAGDKVDANDSSFANTFPYLALPNGEGVNTQSGATAAGRAAAADPSTGSTGTAGTAGTAWMMPATMTAAAAAAVGLGFRFIVAWRRRHRVAPADAIHIHPTA